MEDFCKLYIKEKHKRGLGRGWKAIKTKKNLDNIKELEQRREESNEKLTKEEKIWRNWIQAIQSR